MYFIDILYCNYICSLIEVVQHVLEFVSAVFTVATRGCYAY